MKKKTRNKDNREADQAIVLIGNTYRRNVNPVPVIAVKLLLTYMLAVGTLMSFMDMYDIPFEFGSAIAQVLLFVTADEFLSRPLFISKHKAHFGANVCKHDLIQYFDLNIVTRADSISKF